MKVASKIVPCPIVEAVMEVRFDSQFDAEAVYGLIFNHIRGEYSKVANLPILEFPATIRKNDPKLIFLPYYRLAAKSNSKKLIQIGPRVFSIIISGAYPGWDAFNEEIQYGIERLRRSEVVSAVSRFSLRYLNFFDAKEEILSQTTLAVNLDGIPVKAENTMMRFEIKDDDVLNILTLGSHAEITYNAAVLKGGLIDIDSAVQGSILDFFGVYNSLLKKCHDSEKRLFFRLLSDKFESTLKEVKYE